MSDVGRFLRRFAQWPDSTVEILVLDLAGSLQLKVLGN
jgi:hypothetical protein